MSDKWKTWLTDELKRLGWSYRELARQANISNALVSRTLSGDMSPSADFCIKVAQALDASPEYLLRLAEILPPETTISEDATTQEITELLKHLAHEQRQEALNYIKYLYQRRQG